MRFNKFLMVLFLILSTSVLFAQIEFSMPEQSRDYPMFDVDVFSVASDQEGMDKLDIFVKFVYDELQFIKTKDDRFQADYVIQINIKNQAGEEVVNEANKYELFADDFYQANSRKLFKLHKLTYDLPPDKYKVTVLFKDLETGRIGKKEVQTELKSHSPKEISMSDIIFMDQYEVDEKGVINLRPKVSGERYDNTKLYAFFEVYNLPENEKAEVIYEIFNFKNKVVQKNKQTLIGKGRITRNFIELDTQELTHGAYKVKVTLKYKKKKVEVEKPLKWYWAGIPSKLTNLKEAIEELKWIATKEEMKKLKKAKKEEMHARFVEFWKKRDPTPGTIENELMDEYYRRIAYANENFSSSFKDGWKTDMGMVYIKLGPPDDVERNPFNQDFATIPGRTIKSWEVWVYYQYNRQFVFVDENGFGDYRLVNPEDLYDIIP